MYVSQVTGLDQWDIKFGSHRVITNNHEYLGVIHGDIMYRISKKTREVAMRPVNNEQLTGWHMKYVDALSEAKELIKKTLHDAQSEKIGAEDPATAEKLVWALDAVVVHLTEG